MKRIELEERLIDFSVRIIEIATALKRTKAGRILEDQIVRSGTSCALNYGEAIGAESTKDFIHKIQVVLKELRETFIALRIIKKSGLSKSPEELTSGLDENNQLISIFVKSVYSNKNR